MKTLDNILNIGDRVKIGNAKYQSELQNKLNAGKTGTIIERYFYPTLLYVVILDEPYNYLGYECNKVNFLAIDDALEKMEEKQ